MSERKYGFVIGVLAVLILSGCAANDDLSIETGSIQKNASPTKLAADPVCVALWSRIEEIHSEGTPGRIQKVAEGKTKTVVVKRSSLATMAKLAKLNQDFKSKCSTFTPARAAQAKPNHVPVPSNLGSKAQKQSGATAKP